MAMSAAAETVAETVTTAAVAALPQLNGRDDCCSSHHDQVTAGVTTIFAADT